MAYYIANHMLKEYRFFRFPGWVLYGPGIICIREEYSDRLKIKQVKNPEWSEEPAEDTLSTLEVILGKLKTALDPAEKFLTHENETYWGQKEDLVWRITMEDGKIWLFDALQVGWILCRLKGLGKIRWSIVPYTDASVLIFSNQDRSLVYALVTSYYPENES